MNKLIHVSKEIIYIILCVWYLQHTANTVLENEPKTYDDKVSVLGSIFASKQHGNRFLVDFIHTVLRKSGDREL